MTEMEQLHYNDVMADLASVMETYGTRKFLSDFENNYPKHFEEVQAQIHRTDQQRRLPRLLDKDFPVAPSV